jgi:hypothetical protein
MEQDRESTSGRGLRIATAVLAVLLLAAVVWIIVLLNPPGGDDPGSPASPSATDSATPSATATATSSAPASPSASETSTEAPGTGDLDEAEAANVVWPHPAGPLLYDDPVDAATGFAEDLAGFSNPLVGDFMQGDSRSGEIEVKAATDGPATTVLVRQMSDGNWYTIAATTPDIDVTRPAAGETVGSPIPLEGRARAFEGHVGVTVHGWDSAEPVGEGFVLGSGGPELGPFEGEVEFNAPGADRGALLFTIDSAKDGSVWAVAALPVGFDRD